MDFYLHEDDWGRVELVPEENRLRAVGATEEARAFAEAHRAPGGGWTDVYLIPEMPISFAARGVTHPALCALLPELSSYARVVSGYAGQRDELPMAFAVGGAAGVLYGSRDGEQLTSLHLAHPSEAMAPLLDRLGRAHRLTLIDWPGERVIDLADPRAVAAWLRGDE